MSSFHYMSGLSYIFPPNSRSSHSVDPIRVPNPDFGHSTRPFPTPASIDISYNPWSGSRARGSWEVLPIIRCRGPLHWNSNWYLQYPPDDIRIHDNHSPLCSPQSLSEDRMWDTTRNSIVHTNTYVTRTAQICATQGARARARSRVETKKLPSVHVHVYV